MGMTINEAMTNLESLQKDYQDFHDEVWKDPETYSINAESLKIAIDTMRKYQTMQEVLEKVWNASSYMLDKTPIFNLECLTEIMETYRIVR